VSALVVISIAAWLGAGIACYAFLRRVSYNILDPVIVVSVFVPFSAALLSVLCATDLVAWSEFTLFFAVLAGYLVGARIAGVAFRKEIFRQKIIAAAEDFTRAEIKAVLLSALAATALLALLGVLVGAQGDNRQEFGKIFRPLLLIQNGLFLTCLVLLLSRRIAASRAAAWVLILAALSIPFSGKGVLVPVLYWLGLRRFLVRRRVTLRSMTVSALVIIAGVGVMALTAYGKSGITGIFALLGDRLWMSGDVYIYAYQLGGLEALRGNYNVSFLAYILHPIVALVGIQTYQLPLGSALASQAAGETVLTGPNPQLPVLLDFFFQGSLVVAFLVACAIGFIVVGLRPLGVALGRSRARFVRLGGLVAAIFAPAGGFIDNEQVLMCLVGVGSVVVAGTLLDLLFQPLAVPRATGAGVPS
jgi:hypothetical protein